MKLGVLFQWGLRLNAALTRRAWGRPLEAHLLTPLFVGFTRLIRGGPRVPVGSAPEALGREWERLLGNPRYARLTRVDVATSTAYGEITGVCPLRGSGDVGACHRLMAYDRKLMAAHGARFVVLATQAEPGRHRCEIALRPYDLQAEDLVPAHRRG